LTSGNPVEAADHLLLACHDPVCVARHLLVTRGDPVGVLPHRVEIERYCAGLLLIGRRGRSQGWPDRVRRVLWNWFDLRRQPVKRRVRACDQIAIRLPSQGGSNADTKSYQKTDEGDRSLANRGQPVWISVIFQVGLANKRCVN
jgi:hypothetical protein